MVYLGPVNKEELFRQAILEHLREYLGIADFAHINDTTFSPKEWFIELLKLPRFDNRIFCLINFGVNKATGEPDVGITTIGGDLWMISREIQHRIPLSNPKYLSAVYKVLMSKNLLQR